VRNDGRSASRSQIHGRVGTQFGLVKERILLIRSVIGKGLETYISQSLHERIEEIIPGEIVVEKHLYVPHSA